MRYYFCKLLPPRPTFMADITPAETALMQEHGRYWRGVMSQGKVVAFGPVADPKGAFGVAIVRLQDDTDITSLTDHDPVILANAGFRFEILAMPQLVHPEFAAG
ncbi:MAG TPA: YciI family protein [Gammaproteobacteria bacterium]|nr:YciI family protein [Gammaproteobacteria bacterium]